MRLARSLAVAASTLVLVGVVAGCGQSSSTTSTTASTAATTSTTARPASSTTVATPTTTGGGSTTVTAAAVQPAVWPVPSVAFATPEEAAGSFVQEVFGVTPVLGAFRPGDSRSGEIDVLFAGEGVTSLPAGETGTVRSTLLLRQLGEQNGWFVIGAASGGVTVDTPAAGAEVPAGSLPVTGQGRGFEGTLVVSAFPQGESAAVFEEVVTQAGSLEATQPYQVSLDVSRARPGTVVVVLARGGVGADGDTGEFSAVPVVVS